MVQILLTWLYIFITSYCAGNVCVGWTEGLIKNRDERNIHPVFVSLTGLLVITVVAGYLSLFLKTGLVINCLLWLFCLLYLLRKRSGFFAIRVRGGINTITVLGLVSLLAVLALLLVKASGPITTPDSGGYHLPFIRWIEDYPVIKGLANLHSRFGFNYQYHVLCAVYGFSFLGIPTAHAMNAYLMLMLVLYIVTTLSAFTGKAFTRLDVIRLIVLLFVLNMSNATSSFSPDFPATALILLVILLTLERIESNTSDRFNLQALLIFTLSIGAILFKISSIPVFFFNLFYLPSLFKQKKWLVLTGLVLTGIIYISPYLIRNYYISGYLVYPLYALDIFHVPWKLPLEQVVREKEVILSYALGLPDGAHPNLYEKIHAWIPYLKATNTAYIYMIGLLLTCIVINFASLVWIGLRKQVKAFRGYILLYLLLYICLLYWWQNAPDPRFGNGYIIPFIAITIGLTGYPLIKKLSQILYAGSFALVIILAAGMMKGQALSKVANNYNQVHYNFIFQEKYPVPDTTAYYNAKNQVIYKVPNNKGCWDLEAPCCLQQDSCDYAGASISAGFISKNVK